MVTSKWPLCIERCLKSYDSAGMDWDNPISRYTIIHEIYTRGLPEAFDWLFARMTFAEVRAFIASFKGDGMGEAQRQQFRELFGFTEAEIPKHPFRDGREWLRELPPEVVEFHARQRNAP